MQIIQKKGFRKMQQENERRQKNNEGCPGVVPKRQKAQSHIIVSKIMFSSETQGFLSFSLPLSLSKHKVFYGGIKKWSFRARTPRTLWF